MAEFTSKLVLRHDTSTSYYHKANGQVEAVNKVLVTMLQRTIGMHKSNWHLMLFSALWAYRTSVKDVTGFIPFQIFYGLEATLPIECEIPSLKIDVEYYLISHRRKNVFFIWRGLMELTALLL